MDVFLHRACRKNFYVKEEGVYDACLATSATAIASRCSASCVARAAGLGKDGVHDFGRAWGYFLDSRKEVGRVLVQAFLGSPLG